jgi:putative ATPase
VAQQYPPDELVGRDYYHPSGRGAERALAERLAKLRGLIRGSNRVADRATESDASADR